MILRGAVLCAVLILAGGVAAATGAIPDGDGTVQGCFQKNNGQLRVVDEAGDCRSSEVALGWNKQGSDGAKGDPGPAGPPGPPGPAGPSETSRAFEAGDLTGVTIPVGGGDVILTKSLPAGKYVLSASINVSNGFSGSSAPAGVTCWIPDANPAAGATVTLGSGGHGSISIDATRDFAGGQVAVFCVSLGQPMTAGSRVLTAIKVDSIG